MDAKPLRIVRLEAENVKRLVAVSITPEGHLVVVGGKNGAGKSSTLDAIAYALGGKDLMPAKPLRQGADHGHVEVDLGEFRVRRTFTESGGGQLAVLSPEGARYPSPQALLDKLVGRLTFDPLAFARMEPRAQRETLRELVGLDFTAHEAKRAGLYGERTDVHRTVRTLEGRLSGMVRHEDAPAEPFSLEALVGELEEAEAQRLHAADLSSVERGLAEKVHQLHTWIDEAETERERLEAQIREIDKAQAERADALRTAMGEHEKAAESARLANDAVPDSAPIRVKIAAAEGLNAKHRANLEREACAADLEETRREWERLSNEIDGLDAVKATALASAAFPVPGLSFDETGVLLEGLPFEQASSAEQLRVSVAMGLAANPRLKVLLIRDGSLLDEDSLGLVASMAAEADAQVWLEKVSEDGRGCAVVIEEGRVRGAESEAPTP